MLWFFELTNEIFVIFQYTEADLYKQLSYFCHVFDTVCYIEKVCHWGARTCLMEIIF